MKINKSVFVSVRLSACLSLYLFHFSPHPSVCHLAQSTMRLPTLKKPVPLPIPSTDNTAIVEEWWERRGCSGFEELVSAPLSVMLWLKCYVCMYLCFTWCYAVRVCECVCLCMLCDVWWVMNRQMVFTPGFGGADMPAQEIQSRKEALHGCVCLSHECV